MNALQPRPSQILFAVCVAVAGVVATVGSTVVGYQQVAAQAVSPAPTQLAAADARRT